MDDIYVQIAIKIIERQESVMGPIALQQAMQVSNMAINWAKHTVSFFGDQSAAIDNLVTRYQEMFGMVAVGMCRDVSAELVAKLPLEKRPKSLV